MSSNQPSNQATVVAENNTLIDSRTVEKMLGIGRDALIDLRKNARLKFPRPLDLGGRLLRWHPNDIEAWMATRREAAAA